MTQIYRTTKIPEYYFNQIEEHLTKSNEYVSVSEFIRESIKEKISKIRNNELTKIKFLVTKDIIFNQETLQTIHNKILLEENEKGILKENMIEKIINSSLDIDYLKFLSKYLINFAYMHPFNDGNKRTSWISADIFLRLNNKKLKIKAEKDKETKDEIFIWQNSVNKKKWKDVKQFLDNHIIEYNENTEDLDSEIKKSIKENKLIIEKLAR